jgi:putative transposase
LWRCIRYIELNMVRCGVVSHPKDWEWSGHREIMGMRRRYRLLDLDRLCWRLGTDQLDDVRAVLNATLQDAIARDELQRQACWTESLAIGTPPFLERVQPMVLSRQETEIVEQSPGFWILREPAIPYGSDLVPKIAPKT